MTSLLVIADHLWQSTLVAAGVWALTAAFRCHHARVRYWLWIAASAKFLVPFAALVAVGQWLAWESPTTVRPDVPMVVAALGQPFSPMAPAEIASSFREVSTVMGWLPAAIVIVWAAGCAMHLVTWLVRRRRLASRARAATPVEPGIELTTLHRLERRVGAAPHRQLRVRASLRAGRPQRERGQTERERGDGARGSTYCRLFAGNLPRSDESVDVWRRRFSGTRSFHVPPEDRGPCSFPSLHQRRMSPSGDSGPFVENISDFEHSEEDGG